jgi:hypothetical protein
MKLFASLSCVHKYGIPTQGFFLSILVVLCCVQRAAGGDVFTCPVPETDSGRSSWWTNTAKTAFRCNLYKNTHDWEEPTCYTNYGFTHTENKEPTKKEFHCKFCRGDQTWINFERNLCRCSPGFFSLTFVLYDESCYQCESGKYTSQHSMISCTDCPSGKTSSVQSSGCQDCAAGKYSANLQCTFCEEGKSSAVGSISCYVCPVGKYSNPDTDRSPGCKLCNEGQSTETDKSGILKCNNCAAGKYSNSERVCTSCDSGKVSAEGRSQCSDCPSPKYSSSAASSCLDCEAGKYWSALNSCTECGEGKYSQSGASACSQCVFPAGALVSPSFNALGKGATGCRFCVVGTYTDMYCHYSPGGLACKRCDEGLCDGARRNNTILFAHDIFQHTQDYEQFQAVCGCAICQNCGACWQFISRGRADFAVHEPDSHHHEPAGFVADVLGNLCRRCTWR